MALLTSFSVVLVFFVIEIKFVEFLVGFFKIFLCVS